MAKGQKNEDIGEDTEGAEARIYEVGYHLVSNVPEENLPAESAKVKDAIVSFGGVIFSEEEPKFTSLAYEMDKAVGNKRVWFEGAYFGWIKFEAAAAVPAKLKKFLEENENVLRFLIVKTVRENTMVKKSLLLAKPPVVSPISPGKSFEKDAGEEKGGSAASKVVDEEALDKQIDELMIQ